MKTLNDDESLINKNIKSFTLKLWASWPCIGLNKKGIMFSSQNALKNVTHTCMIIEVIHENDPILK